MSGIQVSGLLSNSAFDWKSIVDQLVAIDTVPITNLGKQQDSNNEKIAALGSLETALTDLKDSLQTMRADSIFSARTVSSDLANTTWKSSSVTGAPIGSYTIAVEKLASASKLQGALSVSTSLATSSDVTGLTVATMRTGTSITAGTFTVNGKQIAIELTDTLQNVFDKISLAAPDVTSSYSATNDTISLTRASGELLLGAGNDTSNFLSAMKLANNGTGSTSSWSALGTLKQSSPLTSAGLAGAITAVDSSGNGAFSINGVAIDFNVNSDSIGSLMRRINESAAGVTASYDSANDRMLLTNNATGDVGISTQESSGGVLEALGLSTNGGGLLVRGSNAQLRVNGGPLLQSSTNTLDSSVHGIVGLNVTVNSETSQILHVESDSSKMDAAIKSFIEKFNAVQDFIETNTKVTISGSKVSTSLLSGNREIQEWARKLQQTAFDTVSGISGSVTRLESLGIDFDGVSGKLAIKDSGKLAVALSEKPSDLENFFLNPSSGFVGKMYGYLSNVISADRKQQNNLTTSNSDLDEQISTLKTRLAATREQLTNSFLSMLDAQSNAQSQSSYLTNSFFKSSSN